LSQAVQRSPESAEPGLSDCLILICCLW
jgi:hypothetical protein